MFLWHVAMQKKAELLYLLDKQMLFHDKTSLERTLGCQLQMSQKEQLQEHENRDLEHLGLGHLPKQLIDCVL